MPTNRLTKGAEAVMAAAKKIDRVTPLTANDLDLLSSQFTAWRERLDASSLNTKVGDDASLKWKDNAPLSKKVDDLQKEMYGLSLGWRKKTFGEPKVPYYNREAYKLESELKSEEERKAARKEQVENTRRKQFEDHRRALESKRRRTERNKDYTQKLVRLRTVEDDASPPQCVYVCGGAGGRSRQANIPFAGEYVQLLRDSSSPVVYEQKGNAFGASIEVMARPAPFQLRQYTTEMYVPPNSSSSPPVLNTWCFIDAENRVRAWTKKAQPHVTKLIGRRGIEYEVIEYELDAKVGHTRKSATGTSKIRTKTKTPIATTTTRRILIVPTLKGEAPNFLCNTVKGVEDKNKLIYHDLLKSMAAKKTRKQVSQSQPDVVPPAWAHLPTTASPYYDHGLQRAGEQLQALKTTNTKNKKKKTARFKECSSNAECDDRFPICENGTCVQVLQIARPRSGGKRRRGRRRRRRRA